MKYDERHPTHRRPGGTRFLRNLRLAVAAGRSGRAGLLPALRRELAWRHHHSIQYTWALVIAAAICYIPANVLPVLNTTTLGSADSDTIMGGVVFLYTSGSWPLALIVLIASVMVPLGKLVALAYLLITVQRGSLGSNRERTRLYRMVEFIGRWSMLDVFVDTFTVALVQLQPLMSVEPGPGVLFFAAVVVLTMIAAESFDPRLIWDSRKRAEGLPWLRTSIATTCRRPRSCRREATRISVVWIIPILAAVVAIGIAIQRILSEGPTITIVFKAAEGVEAGKTFIKYKDVNIGQVTAVQLSPDHSKVEVTAKIDKSAAGLMVEDAKFWVVEPRVTLSGVSGLGTLLSGNYIGFEAGKSDKKQRTVHRARGAADHHRRPAGPAVRAQGRRPRLAGDRLADLLPPPAGRPGRRLRPVERWQGGRDQDLRQRALRQVRQPRHTLLERERHRRLSRRGRSGRAHAVSSRAARGRRRVRHAALRRQGRARRREHGLHALH